MKVILLVSAVFLSGVSAGCVKPKSVAASYKAKMSAGDAEAAPAADSETPAPEGDVEKGKALLVPCAGCHPNTAKVVLNADAVARLDEAFTGKQTATHGTMKAAFEDGRLDLEAALNEIPGATPAELKLNK